MKFINLQNLHLSNNNILIKLISIKKLKGRRNYIN